MTCLSLMIVSKTKGCLGKHLYACSYNALNLYIEVRLCVCSTSHEYKLRLLVDCVHHGTGLLPLGLLDQDIHHARE